MEALDWVVVKKDSRALLMIGPKHECEMLVQEEARFGSESEAMHLDVAREDPKVMSRLRELGWIDEKEEGRET